MSWTNSGKFNFKATGPQRCLYSIYSTAFKYFEFVKSNYWLDLFSLLVYMSLLTSLWKLEKKKCHWFRLWFCGLKRCWIWTLQLFQCCIILGQTNTECLFFKTSPRVYILDLLLSFKYTARIRLFYVSIITLPFLLYVPYMYVSMYLNVWYT